jgi:uncharacterized membrane protein HdeD (DUF308 family)
MVSDGYVVPYRTLGLVYVGVLGLAVVGTFLYRQSVLQAAFLGTYVGTTLLIAGLTLFILSVGPTNVSFGRS